MRNMIIASTSTVHGGGFLEYLIPELTTRFEELQIKELLFIPYARPGGLSHDAYTAKVAQALKCTNIKVIGIHEHASATEAISDSQAIFTGGGNTFVLVKMLHDLDCMQPLRKAMYKGTLYLGTSAGSNICGLNMRTTNDMPVVMPSNFKTTGALGYNINPHYEDSVAGSEHMGETKEQRIHEFHCHNAISVVGLREGSYINVKENKEVLCGNLTARIFVKDQPAAEVAPGYDFTALNL
jgi:dipeptidase E